jgi:hypothetical protein
MSRTRNKLNVFAALFCVVAVGLNFVPPTAQADDFGRIVHRIEASYHVHRSHRFLMGFAGLVVQFWHVGGVKSMKAALFEDQRLDLSSPDARLDEVIQAAARSGWQPVVRSFSRRTGETAYVYMQSAGDDVKMLVVSVEPDEAEVVQLKFSPERLAKFLDEQVGQHHRHSGEIGAMAFR